MFNLFGKNYGKSLKEMMNELDEMMESLNWEQTTKPIDEITEKTEKGSNENSDWIRTTYTSPNGIRYTVTTTYYGDSTKGTKKPQSELELLKRQLEKSVEEQDFEKAVELRDKIKNFETNKQEIDKLESELKTAIDSQDFETAIKLRDLIKNMKS